MMRRTGFWFATLCASIMLVPAVLAVDSITSQSELVSRDLLAHGGLKTDWTINLPLQEDETLGPLYIDGDYLYVLTDKNFLFCINRKKGTQRFGVRITKPSLPIQRPLFYDGKVIITVGTRILHIDPHVGHIIDSKPIGLVGRSIACPVARNSENFYIAGSNRRLHVIDATEYFLKFPISADNDSLINSVIVDEKDVIFGTKSGNIVSTPAFSRKPNWQTDIATGLACELIAKNDEIYASSLDTKLYCLNRNNGKSLWPTPFQTGQHLDTSVRVGKELVYQYAGKEGLYAVNRKTGKQVWNLKNGFDLLAEVGTRSYVLGIPSILYVMDNKKAEELYSINVSGVTNYAVNTTDSKMYMAGKKGRVVSVSIDTPNFKIEK